MKLSHGAHGNTVTVAQKQNRFSLKSPFGTCQEEAEKIIFFIHRDVMFCSSFFPFSFSQNNVISDIFILSKTFVSGAEWSHTAKTDFRKILWVVKRNEFLIKNFFSRIILCQKVMSSCIFRQNLHSFFKRKSSSLKKVFEAFGEI